MKEILLLIDITIKQPTRYRDCTSVAFSDVPYLPSLPRLAPGQ